MRISRWYKIGHDKMMQAAFWKVVQYLCMESWKVNNDGLFVKVSEKTILMLRDLCQELIED